MNLLLDKTPVAIRGKVFVMSDTCLTYSNCLHLLSGPRLSINLLHCCIILSILRGWQVRGAEFGRRKAVCTRSFPCAVAVRHREARNEWIPSGGGRHTGAVTLGPSWWSSDTWPVRTVSRPWQMLPAIQFNFTDNSCTVKSKQLRVTLYMFKRVEMMRHNFIKVKIVSCGNT